MSIFTKIKKGFEEILKSINELSQTINKALGVYIENESKESTHRGRKEKFSRVLRKGVELK